MKPARFHPAVARSIEELDAETRIETVKLIMLLRAGESLKMPLSRPMPSVAPGAHELRIRDRFGQLRVFYFTKLKDAILVFHLFRKKTRRTPKREFDTGRKRLREML
jgi:phage-related protein